jgi:hypothetical protein
MARYATKTTTTILLAAALVAGVGIGTLTKSRRAAARGDEAGATCSRCRDHATAKFCDASYIAPKASATVKVNGSKGCCGFEDAKLRASCEAILQCILTTGCGAGNEPSRCLCGDVPAMLCSRGLRPPTGPCKDVYTAALEGGPEGTVIKLFGDPTSPIGVANNSFTCDVDAACPCGQAKN